MTAGVVRYIHLSLSATVGAAIKDTPVMRRA
jgi:hypothetical protein